MSEHINNHSQRQQILKTLIRRLHEGSIVEEVQADFARLLQDVCATSRVSIAARSRCRRN